VDPVFSNNSRLFSAVTAMYPSDWYNSSDGSLDINSHGVPYGFFSTPLPGLHLGV
jgi:hypothetical protein